jgi:hypothetical protein
LITRESSLIECFGGKEQAMTAAYQFHGHAIVSDDDRIADASGAMPDALRNAADWHHFQTALDLAVVVILGRKGHLAHPNVYRRNRLVLSSSAKGIERRKDVWWWNPAEAPLAEALAAAAPTGGRAIIPGGKRVFDFFLHHGYNEFHLARARGVKIPDGTPIFSECASGRTAEALLAAYGLTPRRTEILDADADVTLTVWRRKR